MRKGLIVFFRATFVILAMLAVAFFGMRYYYQAQSATAIERALNAADTPIIGGKDNPFIIVEFFDYRCSHCSALSKIVDEAVGEDIGTTTKILLRPTVVTDEDSYKIAMLVLAADKQRAGATILLHKEIMALSSVPTYETVKAMAASNGIDVGQAETDGEGFKAVIAANTLMLGDIGFYAVPALIIGDKGYMPQTQMPGINELRLMMIDAKTRLKISTH